MESDQISEDAMKSTSMKTIVARRTANPWARYESLKQDLPKNLTPAEFTAACLAIAKRYGV